MASRKEEKERLKAERLERERQAQAGERRKKLVGYGVGGVLACAALVAIVLVFVTGAGNGGDSAAGSADADYPEGSVPEQQIADLDEAAEAANCEVLELDSEGNAHVEPPTEVEYQASPPNSGDHYPSDWTEDGVYGEQPELERLVHAHEHGRIIIQFDQAVPDEVKGGLKALYDEDPYHMILTPNATDMPYEVAATTWTRTLGCEQMNEQVYDAIRAFRDDFRDEGPEFVQ